jgi:hypothetical protein
MLADEPQPDDPLDALLATARWPEVPPASARRVRLAWLTTAARRRRRARFVLATAALAGLAVVWLSPWGDVPRPDRPLPRTVRGTPIALAGVGRPATALELAMLRAAPATRRSVAMGVPLFPLVTGWHAAAAAVAARPPGAGTTFRAAGPAARLRLVERSVGADPAAVAALADLLADPAQEPAAARAVAARPTVWADALFADLSDHRVVVRAAAARALALIDGPVVTGRLIDMARRGVCRPEAVAALVRIHTPQARRFVAVAVGSPSLAAVTRSALAQERHAF